MVTLREIAAAGGVSVRTVTRALNGEPGGNAATCRRVRSLAKRLGYVPNMAARNLKTRRTNMVGIVISDGDYDVINRKNLSLQRRLERHGRYPLLGILPASQTGLRGLLLSWAGIVDTVVFFTWRGNWRPAPLLAAAGMRGIFVDCLEKASGQDSIMVDRSRGIQEGVEALIRAGRRHIVRCGGKMRNRAAGFNRALAACGRKHAGGKIYVTAGAGFEDGRRLGRQLVADGVDAAFFDTDAMALGFLKFAYEQAVSVPGRIAVIGFDDHPAATHSCPALSTVAHPLDEMGEAILRMLERRGADPATVTLPTRFIRRESC